MDTIDPWEIQDVLKFLSVVFCSLLLVLVLRTKDVKIS